MESMPRIGLVLLLGAILAVVPTVVDGSDVVKLTGEDFEDKVTDGTIAFVKFFAPWCGHCRRLAPIWSELGAKFEEGDRILIADVDCTTDKDLCSKHDVKAYPTLRVFADGKEYKKYSGPRDLDSLHKFITDTAAEVTTETTE